MLEFVWYLYENDIRTKRFLKQLNLLETYIKNYKVYNQII